jgi:hypothetical protein
MAQETKVVRSDTEETLIWLCGKFEHQKPITSVNLLKAWNDSRMYNSTDDGKSDSFGPSALWHSDTWDHLLFKAVERLRELEPSVYYKLVSVVPMVKTSYSSLEDEITEKMANLGVAPRLICIRNIGDHVIIGTERYPFTLLDWTVDVATQRLTKGTDDSRDTLLSGRYPEFVVKQLDSLIDLMHREGKVIHCDLRPQNIVICPSIRTVKIIDFGMSRQVESLDQLDKPEIESIISHYIAYLDTLNRHSHPGGRRVSRLECMLAIESNYYKDYLAVYYRELGC